MDVSEQVMGLLQVVVYTAASRLESLSLPEKVSDEGQNLSVKASDEAPREDASEAEAKQKSSVEKGESPTSDSPSGHNIYDVFVQLPKSDLRNLCRLLGYEGYGRATFCSDSIVLDSFLLCAEGLIECRWS